MFDVNGLLESTRSDLVDFQLPYAHQHAPTKDFVAAIQSIKPTTIIGVSTIGGAFTQTRCRGNGTDQQTSVILAIVEPDRACGVHTRAGVHLVEGKGDLCCGVQFPPVHLDGRTFLPGQANNFFIFPAVGMAIYVTQAKRVTDEMFIEAAAGSRRSGAADALLKQGLLYPLQANILETEIKTAARVAKLVFDSGLARVDRPSDVEAFVRRHVYKPEYKNLI